MDSAGINQMISLLFIEGFQIWDVLEIVCIDVSSLNCIVWCHIVCELYNFKLYTLCCKVILDKIENLGMWLWSSTYLDCLLCIYCCGSEYKRCD